MSTTISDEKLAELEAEYGGKIRAFQSPEDPPEWQVVLRKPNGKEATSFRLSANNESRKAYASLDIIKATVVWPDKGELKLLIDEQPFLPEGICNNASWREWVGMETAATKKT